MLFLLTCDLCPAILFAKDTREEALESFKNGLSSPAEYTNHPSFKLKLATVSDIEKIVAASEDGEMRLDSDTSF